MFDGDAVPLGIVWDIFGQFILERQPVLFQQSQDDSSRKLFGDRTDLKDRIAVIFRLFADILKAISFI